MQSLHDPTARTLEAAVATKFSAKFSADPVLTVQLLADSMRAALIERDDEINALLLGLIAREHVLLVGPPGTAKSYLCRSLARGVSGARYCERLLSPTTPPEAVWGPVSLSALRADRYEHATAGYAADAEILYLDEVGRASAAILDSLLHLLGPERQALIGTEQVHAPLMLAVGSANTWPEDAALLDRWLIRRVVRPVSPAGREALLWGELPTVAPLVPVDGLDKLHETAMALPVSDEARATLSDIMDALTREGIQPSDRRSRAAVRVARAAALLDGQKAVQRRHLEPLAMVLWSQPDQADKATEIVTRIANPVGARVVELLRETDEAVQGAGEDSAARLAAIQKLGDIIAQAEKLTKEPGANGRAAKALQHIRREHVRLQAAALGLDPAKAEALLGGAK